MGVGVGAGMVADFVGTAVAGGGGACVAARVGAFVGAATTVRGRIGGGGGYRVLAVGAAAVLHFIPNTASSRQFAVVTTEGVAMMLPLPDLHQAGLWKVLCAAVQSW